MATEQATQPKVPEDLLQRAMQLAPEIRVEFADCLYRSVEPDDATGDWDPEYLAELEERVARYERGETKAVDVFEALEESRRKLRESRKK
jgi:hypothetical protein